MVIGPEMQAPSASFDVRFTVSRRGVVVELAGRRITLQPGLLLRMLPAVRRALSCAS